MPAATQPMTISQVSGLAIIFQELFTVTVRICANRQAAPSMEAFHAQAHEMLRSAEEEARRRGYSAADARLAVFAVVVFLDESILNSGNPVFRDWPRRPLRGDLFPKGNIGGETFYEYVRDLLMADDSARTADLLEVFQLCLLLGYRGRYGPGREADLKAVQDRITEKIARIRGPAGPLAPEAMPPAEAAPKEPDTLGRWLMIAAAILLLLAILLYLIYSFSLNHGLSGMLTLLRILAPGQWRGA